MGAIVVMDMDDVLVDLSSKTYGEIRKQWSFFGHYFVDLGPLKPEVLQSRACFQLNEWLIKKEFENLSSEQYAALQKALFDSEVKTIFNTDLYSDMSPSLLAQRTLLNPLYIDSNDVKKVYILSRSVGEIQEKSKREFVERHFKHPKIEYIHVPFGGNKFDVLAEKGIDWNLLVDDELTNIRHLAEGCKSLKGKEFLIPRFGYNRMPEDLDKLIKGKGGVYTYYDAFNSKSFSLGG